MYRSNPKFTNFRDRNGKPIKMQEALPTRKYTRRTASAPSASFALSKANLDREIRRIIHKDEEVKHYNIDNAINLGAATATNFPNQIIPLSPYSGYISLSQGTESGQRIGNSVKCHKAHLNVHLVMNTYNATTNPTPQPQVVLGWILSQKNSNVVPTTVGGMPDLFEGNNAEQALTGAIVDYQLPVNTAKYTLHHKFMSKIGFAAFVGTPGGVLAEGYWSNNDFKLIDFISMDLTKYMPTKTTFDDSSVVPLNRSVFLVIETVNADGSVQPVGYVPIRLQYMVDYRYTDA